MPAFSLNTLPLGIAHFQSFFDHVDADRTDFHQPLARFRHLSVGVRCDPGTQQGNCEGQFSSWTPSLQMEHLTIDLIFEALTAIRSVAERRAARNGCKSGPA